MIIIIIIIRITLLIIIIIVRSLVWSVLIFGTERWTLAKVDEKRVESAELWIYHRNVRITRTEQHTDQIIPTADSFSSTFHERTPSGPGKSVRALQVAARHRAGWAGGGRQI